MIADQMVNEWLTLGELRSANPLKNQWKRATFLCILQNETLSQQANFTALC